MAFIGQWLACGSLLMTGLDTFRNAAINVSSGRTLLKADLKTMADSFREAGYRTGLFGKWHLGDNFPFHPEDRGFDEAIWFPASHLNSAPDYWDNDYFDDTYMHNGQREKFEGYCTDEYPVPIDPRYRSGETHAWVTAEWRDHVTLTLKSREKATDFTVYAVLWPDPALAACRT